MKYLTMQKFGLTLGFLLIFCALAPAQEESEVRTIILRSNGHDVHRWEWNGNHMHRNPCKVFIGVSTTVMNDVVLVQRIIDDTPASNSELRVGDAILALDGAPVRSQRELVIERDKHQQGDAFTLTILRDGVEMQIPASFKSCSEEEMAQYREQQEARLQYAEEMAGRAHFSYHAERDPCKVFIGIYTGGQGADGQGVRVSGVIEGTPAKESDLQPGDVILDMDGAAVNSHSDLVLERNSHKPGDVFSLTVLRNGAKLTIPAQFKACPGEEAPRVAAKVEEVVEILGEEELPAPPSEAIADAGVEPAEEALYLFPNPTAGILTVQFEGEAVPAVVRITDAGGKIVFYNNLRQFDGIFNEQINLSGNTPGAYILSIEQGGKLITKKILLLPRA